MLLIIVYSINLTLFGNLLSCAQHQSSARALNQKLKHKMLVNILTGEDPYAARHLYQDYILTDLKSTQG